MKKNAFIFLCTIALISCGTMRLKVKAPYRSPQKSGIVTYEKSYPVGGGMPLWCGLTFWYVGGACWAYLAMPFVPAEERAVKDATEELTKKIKGRDLVLIEPEVTRISWGSAEPYLIHEEARPEEVAPVEASDSSDIPSEAP